MIKRITWALVALLVLGGAAFWAVGGQVGDTRFALGIGGHRTTGISAIDVAQHPGENPDLDGYRNVNVNLSVSHLLAPGQTIGFRAQGTQGRFDTDGDGGCAMALCDYCHPEAWA